MTYANHEKILQLVMATLPLVADVDTVDVVPLDLARDYADRDTVFGLSVIAAFYVDQLVQQRPDMSHADAVRMLGDAVEVAWRAVEGWGAGGGADT